MIQNVLRDIGGVGLYGVASVVLFFTVFTSAILWALTRRASTLRAAEVLPLADDQPLSALKGDVRDE